LPVKPVHANNRTFAEKVAYEQILNQYEWDYKQWENTFRASTNVSEN